MIYHFVPFDMRYWNLILHQYKWYIASRQKEESRRCGEGWGGEISGQMPPTHPHYPPPPTPASSSKSFAVPQWKKPISETSVFFPFFFFALSPFTPCALICVFKKNDKLKRSGREFSRSNHSRGRWRVWGRRGRRNMTAASEGDVTRCQGLWHDSLARWNPAGAIPARRLGAAAVGVSSRGGSAECDSVR